MRKNGPIGLFCKYTYGFYPHSIGNAIKLLIMGILVWTIILCSPIISTLNILFGSFFGKDNKFKLIEMNCYIFDLDDIFEQKPSLIFNVLEIIVMSVILFVFSLNDRLTEEVLMKFFTITYSILFIGISFIVIKIICNKYINLDKPIKWRD